MCVVFSHMGNSVTKRILRCMLGNGNDQQLQHEHHLTTLGIQALALSWHVTQGSTS